MSVNCEKLHGRKQTLYLTTLDQIFLEREKFTVLDNQLRKIFPQGFRYRKEPILPGAESPFGQQAVVDRRIIAENNEGEFILEKVKINGNGEKEDNRLTNNPLLNYLLKENQEQQQLVLDYLNNQGPLICLQRVASSDAFRQAYKEHSDRFDGGYAPVTEALAILLTLEKNASLPESQIASFQRLQELSSISIYFIPLTDDENIKRAFTDLNKKADPFEIIYNIHVAQGEINSSETVVSLAATIAGGGVGTTLDNISEGLTTWFENTLSAHISPETAIKLGKASTMALVHAISELFTILQTRADTLHIPSLHSKNIQSLIKTVAISLQKLPSNVQNSFINTIRTLFQRAKEDKEFRTTVAMTLIPIILGTVIASATGFLPAFFSIAPINTWLINYREIHRRRQKIDEELKDCTNHLAFIDSFLKAKYPFLNKIPYINKLLSRRLALIDFASSNKPALGSLIGTSLGFIALTIYYSIPEPLRPIQMKEEFLYAVSAILSEQVPALIAGTSGKLLDPWSKFNNFLKIIDKLDTSYTRN